MRSAPFFSIAMLLAAASPCAAGAVRLTPEFRQEAVKACTGDAVRLCPQTLFDEERTTDCMAAHRAQLSPDCRAVYDRGTRLGRP